MGLRGWKDLLIVVLSGRPEQAEKVRALDAGADDYVTKPFAMEELLARLRAVLWRREFRADSGAAAGARFVIGPSLVDLSLHCDPRR